MADLRDAAAGGSPSPVVDAAVVTAALQLRVVFGASARVRVA
ncbi:unannotated protein [freshwater metagenome]|uniref:Unannotated protein n=1 Tax=freshwater metagenome TaxID=449393 RepID=A0A6J6GS47_9ZZZZ